jgi:hypothetical protein
VCRAEELHALSILYGYCIIFFEVMSEVSIREMREEDIPVLAKVVSSAFQKVNEEHGFTHEFFEDVAVGIGLINCC